MHGVTRSGQISRFGREGKHAKVRGWQEKWVRGREGERGNLQERIHKRHKGKVQFTTDTRSDEYLRKREQKKRARENSE